MIQSFYATWLPTYLVRERHFSLAFDGRLRLAALGRPVRHPRVVAAMS